MKTTLENKKAFDFKLLQKDPLCEARTGIIQTAHGPIETPVFMPVGTRGTVKSLTPCDLEAAGAEIILSNTYHLYIRPGSDIIKRFGGLHQFMGWQHPILTDSGGYQVFSLTRIREISEEGVRFRSHFDGKEIFLTPEKVVEIQEDLASDIAMIFDECPPAFYDEKQMRDSMELTLRWSKRAKKHHKLETQALFGIAQGGSNPALREECAKAIIALGFDGYAI